MLGTHADLQRQRGLGTNLFPTPKTPQNDEIFDGASWSNVSRAPALQNLQTDKLLDNARLPNVLRAPALQNLQTDKILDNARLPSVPSTPAPQNTQTDKILDSASWSSESRSSFTAPALSCTGRLPPEAQCEQGCPRPPADSRPTSTVVAAARPPPRVHNPNVSESESESGFLTHGNKNYE